MHQPARLVLAGTIIFGSLAASVPALAAGADTTAARPATAHPRGSIALASFRIGMRLATRVRFPTGVGLGLAVCTAGIVIELDNYVRSR